MILAFTELQPLETRTLPLTVDEDPSQILRYLGYSSDRAPPSSQFLQRAEGLAALAVPSLEPRGTYSLYAVGQRTAKSITVGGITLAGQIGTFLAGVERVVVFLVTVGDAISDLARNACSTGDVLSGWYYDAVGSWGVEAAVEALLRHLEPLLRPDEALTLRYSPGYCGLDLGQQEAVFRLANPSTIGVTLLPSLLMQPEKSVSAVVGLGPRGLAAGQQSPCDRCSQVGCHMRRPTRRPPEGAAQRGAR